MKAVKSKFFRLEIRWRAYRLPVWVALSALLIFLAAMISLIIMVTNRPTENDDEPAGRLITIYDEGAEKTIFTEADTVGAALTEAEISTDKTDRVEPALDTFLISSSYSVNIYRSRPVLVVDGDKQTRVVTAAQTGLTIAKAAGIKLDIEDLVNISRNSDILEGDGAVMQAKVVRAKPVKLILYGQEMNLKTQSKTIAEFIIEKNLSVMDNDSVIPARNTKIKAGMKIRIWREGVNTITVEEDVPFKTREVQSNDLLTGYRKIDAKGQKGKRLVTYEVEMRGGKEISRKEIQSVVTKQPVTRVELVGIKAPAMATGSHEDWMRSAGVSESDWGYVNFIISHESGWGYTKWNYGGSGAYGLCQALPGGKMSSAGADWETNPVTQLKWCNGYAVGRYGSWAGAYNFWINNHWW
ncbi:MAG: G5 domain-containing protein [Candidatus Nomurabacteria bacterium]|jgi:uncharacterized protein YabE (DUF348 family)|nr:G5 domain-containing protein [Candidatus Nomurabacteria bacterium]